MRLSDDCAPQEAQIFELFKISAIPLNKSDSFSYPSIPNPQISRTKKGVEIHLDKACPRYYSYRIQRYEYASHTTLYEGDFIESFLDDTIVSGKSYEYTITPIYKDKIGKEIHLPRVSTKDENALGDEKIVEEKWWEY